MLNATNWTGGSYAGSGGVSQPQINRWQDYWNSGNKTPMVMPYSPPQAPAPAPAASPFGSLASMLGQGQQGGGMGAVTTSITPQNIYSPEMTAASQSQATALSRQSADPRSATKQFSRPGLSSGAGTMGAAMPQISAAMSAGAQMPHQIALQDATANARNMLQGETGREQEGLGLASLLARQSGFADQQRNAMLSPLMGYLSQML